MRTILLHELKIQNSINHLTQYTAIFLIFCTFSITLVHSQEKIQIFGSVFSVVCIPLAFISLTNGLIKDDVEDGSLENALSSILVWKLILAKYLILCICVLTSFIYTIPISLVLYSVDVQNWGSIIFSGIILITLSSAVALLISVIQAYFRTNTNVLSILIMPIIIPNIIVSGLYIQSPEHLYLATIMVGINLVLIPPSIYLAIYLLENIYNI